MIKNNIQRRIVSWIFFFLFYPFICMHGHTFGVNSVLSTGKWVKIRVADNGLCRLSFSQLRQMGFSSPSNVKVFGYGGAILSEDFSGSYNDDLSEVVSYQDASSIVFYAQGPRRWEMIHTKKGTKFDFTVNHYSNYGYYFLLEGNGETRRLEEESAIDVGSKVVVPIRHYTAYKAHKVEEINYVQSGRVWYGDRFYDGSSFGWTEFFDEPDSSKLAKAFVSVAADAPLGSTVNATIKTGNDILSNSIQIVLSSGHCFARTGTTEFAWNPRNEKINVSLKFQGKSSTDNATVERIVLNVPCLLKYQGETLYFRSLEAMDSSVVNKYIVENVTPSVEIWNITNPADMTKVPAMYEDGKLTFYRSSKTLEEFVAVDVNDMDCISAELVGDVENQNLHSLSGYELVILSHPDFIPEAKRLAEIHEMHDGINAVVVTPEQVYNEYSSGTPDATAIRLFMRQMYERNGKSDTYLLLMGDGSFDNRAILRSASTTINNFILTYQGGSSYDESATFTSDDYYGMLSPTAFQSGKVCNGNIDIGVGRLPVTTLEEAKVMVDKIETYLKGGKYGKWRNKVCLVADDNEASSAYNKFYTYSENLATKVEQRNNSMEVKRIYLDAYTRVTGSNGNRYPDVEKIIKDEIESGVTVMNYIGHSSKIGWTAEHVLTQNQAASMYNDKLGFWITASCQFTQYDALVRSGGEDLVLNPNGGAIAIFSPARVVFDDKNDKVNQAVFENLFTRNEDGTQMRLGDICRMSKNHILNDSNKMSFALLGDPMLRLAYPECNVVTDSITLLDGGVYDTLSALSVMKVYGHIEKDSMFLSDFTGKLNISLYDKKMKLYTKANIYSTEADILANRFGYFDRTNILYSGMTEVENGKFSFIFMVPKDINYNYGLGRLAYYGYDEINGYEANGAYEKFVVGGSSDMNLEDETGPQVSLFLNSTSFVSRDVVNSSPVLYAYVSDESGINASGAGIGHDITLTLQGAKEPIILNQYFTYSMNSYTSGLVEYQLNDLPDGRYKLSVKVWDMLNNSSVETIEFEVKNGVEVELENLVAYPNPAIDEVFFSVKHDYPKNLLEYKLMVFDLSGRLQYESEIMEQKGDGTFVFSWDLKDNTGMKMHNGTYLCKVLLSADGENFAEETKKIVILSQ
ncbi:MAG: type IX secretion system sortase PorU [Paludibacteraceae bacterium]|nr:type IX secretion system sortase PorU [Paludibacteraceae bacterium]